MEAEYEVQLDEATQRKLEHAAKLLIDLEDLLRLLGKSLPLSKPWQRLLSSHLAAAETQRQVLRMTVVMRRKNSEILEAAKTLQMTCRKANASTMTSRADAHTKLTMRLMVDLSIKVEAALRDCFAAPAMPEHRAHRTVAEALMH